MATDLKERIKAISQMPPEEIKNSLPGILEEIEKHGIDKMVAEVPDVYLILISSLIKIDPAKFFKEAPDTANKFLSLFWIGLCDLGAKSEEVRNTCKNISEGVKITQLSINFEATDSPLQAHFIVDDKAKFTHSLGLLHFKDQDFKIYGPTESLLNLFIGKAILGAWADLDYEGHIGPFGLKMSPILASLFKIAAAKN